MAGAIDLGIRPVGVDRPAALVIGAVLLYEHEYMRRVERKRCEAMLASRGYALSRRLGDTLAYLPV